MSWKSEAKEIEAEEALEQQGELGVLVIKRLNLIAALLAIHLALVVLGAVLGLINGVLIATS
jgi:hypothetical protein